MTVMSSTINTATVSAAKPKRKRDPMVWVIKPMVWALCLAPLAWLGWLVLEVVYFDGRGLTANPVEFLNLYLGDWAIRILLVSLAVTPIKILTGWKQIVRLRRLLGLFAFFYVALHVTNYVILDQFFDWMAIWNDILKRWYITVGMIGLLCLTPLAITSTKGWIKRMGGKNWNKLHKLVYVAGAAACLHFFMMRKGIQLEPIIYGGIFLSLMVIRMIEPMKRKLRAI